MFEKLFDEVKHNLKNPRLYILVIVVLILFLLLFPDLDANVFYYNRVNSRIEILQQMSQIDVEKIHGNEVLEQEYNRILDEISKQTEDSIRNVVIKDNDETVGTVKFVTGGLVFWLLSIFCFVIKEFRNWVARVFGIVLFGALGIGAGFIAESIPTVITPALNYIGFPMLIITIIALLATSGKKEKHTGDREV